MRQTVAVMGFESALQGTLQSLLGREPDLCLAGADEVEVDTLILFPPNPEWVHEVHQRYPKARLLAVVDWARRHQFIDTPIHAYVDPLLSYHGLLEAVRDL